MTKKQLERVKYICLDHLRDNKNVFFMVGIFCVIGILIGIILSWSSKNYLSLLTSSNQTLLSYINGTASVFTLFWSRLLSSLWAVILLFVASLSQYMCFLGYAYLCYQTTVFTITSITLIGYHGFSAILNFIFYLLPTNLLLLFSLCIFFSVFVSRCKCTRKNLYSFGRSFSADNFWLKTMVCGIILIAVNILSNLIFPTIIKGIYVINY